MKKGEPAKRGDIYREDEDTRLMLAFQEGSRAAFEQLVTRNQERVFRLAMRYVGDASTAEDITQEVFVRVFNAGENYQPTARFTTWVYRITVNLSLNALRDSQGRPEVPLDGEMEWTLAVRGNPGSEEAGAEMESEELSEAVARVVKGLPEAQRTVLLLRRYEEMSYEEIGELMGKAATAVKSLLARARQNLRAALRKHLES